MAINTDEYEKIKSSAIYCAVRENYTKTLLNINKALNTVFFDDKEFIEYYRNLHFHPYGGVIGGILISVLLFPIVLMVVMFIFDGYGEDMQLMAIFVAMIILIGGGGVVGYFLSRNSVDNQAISALVEYARTRNAAYENRPVLLKAKDEYTKKLSELVSKMYDRSVCVIPQKYWEYAPMLLSYIENCRAHDLESAINVLEMDLHNQRMERTQLMTYLEQVETRLLNERIAQDAEAAREAAEQAEINSRAAATYSEMTWYNTLR